MKRLNQLCAVHLAAVVPVEVVEKVTKSVERNEEVGQNECVSYLCVAMTPCALCLGWVDRLFPFVRLIDTERAFPVFPFT